MIEFQKWIAHSKVRDGVHTFSNRALKITWEAPITIRAALSIVFLTDCFVSDGAALHTAFSGKLEASDRVIQSQWCKG